MFEFGNANEAQRIAIATIAGPVLITAGPGTGKTFTLVQRAIYMIQEKGVAPEQIMLATFTEKAAKELITRITNELADRKISVNINEMYIGTFHSICLRFIKEHLEFTRMRKNYRTIDEFDQKYTVFQNINRFRRIRGFSEVITENGAWRQARLICSYVNNLSEELVAPDNLKKDVNHQISVLGEVLDTYRQLLSENNLVDFASIQTEAYHVLSNNPEVLEEIHSKIQYIMIDEYQDTNYIQEQLVFLLGAKRKNICVVGDDDQGLYRFRGATIRNILEFPYKFKGECKIIPLVTNYRSNSDIVDFYNKWMTTTDGSGFKFKWGEFRYEKTIIPHKKSTTQSSAVIKLSSVEGEDEWHKKVLFFISDLKSSGKLKDLNQIAFLFKSVKNDKVVNLARYLEQHGVNVYSPRSDMFFMRDEIRLLIGCLMLLFPKYVQKLDSRSFDYVDESLCRYYVDCIILTNTMLAKPDHKKLLHWIREKGKLHCTLKINTDYAFSGLIYQLFEFKPFKNYLDLNINVGVIDLRPTRNIAMLSQIVNKYEYLHRVDVLSGKKIESDTERLFNMYLRFLFHGGIAEYEDDSEYAPSGCVSFLTIHQSKGMEFPIVVVGSLSNVPRKSIDELIIEIEEKYFKRAAFEPYDKIKYFDFWRLYYTAFSRAQNLLVLSCNETKKEPSKYFDNVYSELKAYEADEFNITAFDFEEVKDVNLKETYSFTSHISVYENCALQYKFFKELGFTPIRVGATVFGVLIHQTIEDIHRAAMRKEEHLITPQNINTWLMANYTTLSKSEHTYLGQPQIDAALKQVNRYAEKQKGRWNIIQEAEVEVSLVKPNYIIEGTIDLIRGDCDTVELVDFKSEKKPDLVADKEKIEHYKKQLQVYAHLVEERTGHTVSKMHLYYTGEEGGVPTVSFARDKESIDATIREFDDIVNKIQKKNFTQKSRSQTVCDNCDFRFYCKN
jgi:DNA helicase II / ATP-dependent DNA helicase PcrA